MVSEVKAWRTADGNTFATKELAIEHELRLQLKKLEIFNEGTINKIIERRDDVGRALGFLPSMPETHDAQHG